MTIDIDLWQDEIDYLLSVNWDEDEEWVKDGMLFKFCRLESVGILLTNELDSYGRYPKDKDGYYRVYLSVIGNQVVDKLKNEAIIYSRKSK